LNVPHILAVIDTHSEWYYSIHPERYVPAIRDRDPVSGEDAIVFEGTACIQYLADRFDKGGSWTGRTAAEKAAVMSWTEYQTAGIGYDSRLCYKHYSAYSDLGPPQSTGYTSQRDIRLEPTRCSFPVPLRSKFIVCLFLTRFGANDTTS
jgi:glutathione S-transferase